jgi:hypothetical protein
MEALTREALYERVWATPMAKLAEELGTTSVLLKRLCDRAGIPTPPSGYWMKKEFGKSAEPAPLGSAPPGLSGLLFPSPAPAAPAKAAGTDARSNKAAAFEAGEAALTEKSAEAPPPRAPVPTWNSREELHALVWSHPMRSLAKLLGISDVALAKHCRKALVPVPPRGWWARKEAGKRVEVQSLPPLPFAMANYFPAIDRDAVAASTVQSAAAPNGDESSALPVFRDIAAVSAEIQAAVRAIKVPATLTSPHPIVARLLKQDSLRAPSKHEFGYLSDYYGPKFAKPIQQRRLRILSCVLAELERLGCKIRGSTHAGEQFSIRIGGRWTYILFAVEGGSSRTQYYRDRQSYKQSDAERLRFDLTDDDRGYKPPARTWREDHGPLEHRCSEIVCGIFLQVEEDARKWALWLHNDKIQQRAREAKEAKLAAEKAEVDRIAREKAAAAARIKQLIDGADALERAARIRRYVASVRTETAKRADSASTESLEAWADWALAEADRIDPVVSGQFLEGLTG